MPTAEKTTKQNESTKLVDNSEEQLSNHEAKKCFIITPIGEENTEIRKQIEGVIDVCIVPVLKDFNYEVVVAHRIYTPGSINNQVLGHIYNDEMVIANLTGLNPNVMYELAFRHAIKKPVIVIKDTSDESKLPFDIQDDRVIFFSNDINGTDELKKNLTESMKEIDCQRVDNPIIRAITYLNSIKNNYIVKEKPIFYAVENINTSDEYLRCLASVNAFCDINSGNYFIRREIIKYMLSLVDKYIEEPNSFTMMQKQRIESLFKTIYEKLDLEPLT